jgi:hypothetical protein
VGGRVSEPRDRSYGPAWRWYALAAGVLLLLALIDLLGASSPFAPG